MATAAAELEADTGAAVEAEAATAAATVEPAEAAPEAAAKPEPATEREPAQIEPSGGDPAEAVAGRLDSILESIEQLKKAAAEDATATTVEAAATTVEAAKAKDATAEAAEERDVGMQAMGGGQATEALAVGAETVSQSE